MQTMIEKEEKEYLRIASHLHRIDVRRYEEVSLTRGIFQSIDVLEEKDHPLIRSVYPATNGLVTVDQGIL